MKNLLTLMTTLALLVAPLTHASDTTEQIKLSQCLAKHLPSSYKTVAENKAFKIVEIPNAEMRALAQLADKHACGRFINVSPEISEITLSSKPRLTTEPEGGYAILHTAEVMPLLQEVNQASILATLTHLTAYHNRSALSITGVETAHWLKKQFDAMSLAAGRKDTNSWFVPTGRQYRQPSVVTVIGKDIKAPAVVIGAHMDTFDGRMPGAGDDGSGSASIMEIARLLLAHPQTLQHPVYIIWYAAEERGLVGSQRVVADFLKKEIPVKAVMQFDMVGFRRDPADPRMWLFTDYTDKPLTEFLAELITSYINVPVGRSQCGYGCSDHAIWNLYGIPAVFPNEMDFEHINEKIHTPEDTMDRLSPEHMVNFTKLGLAFILELAL